MPKDVSEFLGFGVGDVVTLSDLQTQAQYNDTDIDFRIVGLRHYHEPNDCFTLTCYMLEDPGEDDLPLMLVVKQVNDVYDLFVYYLEEEGELYAAEDGQEECPLLILFKEDEDDLKERIEAVKEDKTITWDKQNGSTFGVEYEDDEGDTGITTLAEYYTEDENEGNDRCLVDWRGSKDIGSVEAWYGCIVEDHEVEILATGGAEEDEDY